MNEIKDKQLNCIHSHVSYYNCKFSLALGKCRIEKTHFHNCTFQTDVVFEYPRNCKFIKCCFDGKLGFDLSFIPWSEILPYIFDLHSVTDLNLMANGMKELPSEIKKLKMLERLSLYCNQLDSLPEEIWDLKNLRFLNLSLNQLEYLPEEITKLSHLTQLFISRNRLTSISKKIKLPMLKTLNLHINNLSKFPTAFLESPLTELDISQNKLISIPEEVEKFKNLTLFNLCSNKLKTLPKKIQSLTNLKHLLLLENSINISERTWITDSLPNCKVVF
ncbi:leucine-rich repeat domain-containing protein [Candidatus Uabimicrobium sp. HlEnr_7]|uniref:leucine-rich repeat domain-containing protein n=1 Tax=Candidatus Uabimicrobium helgolandensis TaxID=3095367 RepID=UPI0035586AC1